MHVTPYSQWPSWLQTAVIVPHGLLAAFAFFVWWPKTERSWKAAYIVAGYLLLFYLVMHFVFKA